MMFTDHFSLEEFVISRTAAVRGIDNTPPREVVTRLQLVATSLERIREILERPIVITSGYRSLELNRLLKSKDNSAHVKGYAVDFVAPAFGNPAMICRALEQRPDLPFDQMILEHTWVHWSIEPGLRRQLLTLRSDGGFEVGIHERGTA